MAKNPLPFPAELAHGLSVQDALELVARVQGLVGVTSVHELSRSVCDSARALLNADGATLVLREGDRLRYVESADGRAWKGSRCASEACISGWTIRHRQTAVVRDVYDDPRIPVKADLPTFVRSLVMVPMLRGDEATGAIGAYWADTHEATERELFLLAPLAEAAAAALRATAARGEERLQGVAAPEEPREEPLLATLLPIVAHDLRTPLSAIIQGLDLLEREKLSDVGRRALQRMHSSSRRAARMVGQLMDYSEITRHESLPLRLESCRLDRVADQALEELQSDYPSAPLQLDCEPVDGLWDPKRLTQAIGNLVRNAVDHGNRERPVTISVCAIEPHAKVSVHNWGAPIPSEERRDLFEAFKRTARQSGSIDMGLYLTDQITRAHGGRIEIESTLESGTRFTLVLPKHPAVS